MVSSELKKGEQYIQNVLRSNGYYRVQINDGEDPTLEADGSIRKILVYVTTDKSKESAFQKEEVIIKLIERAKNAQREFWVAMLSPEGESVYNVNWLNLTQK